MRAPTVPWSPPPRVMARVLTNVVPVGDCLMSTYSKTATGYAQVGWYEGGVRRMTVAHRVAWAAINGPIPPTMTIDHLCRNRWCVNAEHLRLLTASENCRDNAQSRRTHCPHGHPYDEANTRINKNGHRFCRTCSRVRWRQPPT